MQPDDRVAAEVGGTWIGDDRSLSTSGRGIAFTGGTYVDLHAMPFWIDGPFGGARFVVPGIDRRISTSALSPFYRNRVPPRQ